MVEKAPVTYWYGETTTFQLSLEQQKSSTYNVDAFQLTPFVCHFKFYEYTYITELPVCRLFLLCRLSVFILIHKWYFLFINYTLLGTNQELELHLLPWREKTTTNMERDRDQKEARKWISGEIHTELPSSGLVCYSPQGSNETNKTEDTISALLTADPAVLLGIKLSEGDFNTWISTVASPKAVDLKALELFFSENVGVPTWCF